MICDSAMLDWEALQPAGAGCRTAARRVQRMVSSKSGGGLQEADDDVVEASTPARPHPAPDEKPSIIFIELILLLFYILF
jgi:hypothetical protein